MSLVETELFIEHLKEGSGLLRRTVAVARGKVKRERRPPLSGRPSLLPLLLNPKDDHPQSTAPRQCRAAAGEQLQALNSRR